MRRPDGGAEPQASDRNMQKALIGAGLAAAAGAIFFAGARLLDRRDEPFVSDAPRSTFRGKGAREVPVQRTVTINRPRQELYDFWRDFANLPRFMENVRSVERLDGERWQWVIEAPAGSTVSFVSRITEDESGRRIAWEAEEGADSRNRGAVEFIDAAPGRGTMVRATIVYQPPAGAVGRAIAKLLQREPNIQARRDLRRFKQLMETGEVTTSAGPSGRRSEEPTKQYL